MIKHNGACTCPRKKAKPKKAQLGGLLGSVLGGVLGSNKSRNGKVVRKTTVRTKKKKK